MEKISEKINNHLTEDMKLKSFLNFFTIVMLIIILIFLLMAGIFIIYENNNQSQNLNSTELLSNLEENETTLKIISRREWLAQPSEQSLDILKAPVPYVIILHTATENCSNQAKCTAIVRITQTFHMESKGWWDIGYNFLVGGDGYVYEGRGWQGQGAHVYGWNSKSIGIAFIGSFNKIVPPPRQLLACKQLIEKGVKEGYIAQNYTLFAQRQLSSTQSSGEALYGIIKTWSHWTENYY